MYLGQKNTAGILPIAGASLLSLVFLYFGARNLLNTKPALKLGPAGIWTPKLGFCAWRHVQVGLDAVSASRNVGSLEFLVIKQRQSRETLQTLPLVELSGPTEEVKFLLQRYNR